MILPTVNRLISLVVLMLATAFFGWADVFAQTSALDRIGIESLSAGSEIQVYFNFPLRYIVHTPAKRGDILQIEVRPLVARDLQGQRQGEQETLSQAPNESVPLKQVSYEELSEQAARVTLTFARPVEFKVSGSPDSRSIVVTLLATEAAKPADPSPSAPLPEPVLPDALPPEKPAPAERAAIEPAAKPPADVDLSHPYAVNLQSTTSPVEQAALPDLEVFGQHRLYTTQFTKDGQLWHRLRLGFFPTKEAAEIARASVLDAFPGAWVTKVPSEERERSTELAFDLRASATTDSQQKPQAAPEKPAPAATGATGKATSGDLMADVRAAMTGGDTRRAIQLLTKILQRSDNPDRQEAQELLGLARERNGQLAHAKAEYETYLKEYPEGEAAERVRQRLAGLLTARAAPKKKLRATGVDGQESDVETRLSGSWSQFYSRDESFTDIDGRTINQSELDSNLDVDGSIRDDRYEAGVRISGGYLRDFEDPGPGSDGRVTTAYVDAFDSKTELSGRIGRQTRSSGGVLGRFDGGLASYQISPKVKANAVAGLPVETTTGLTIDADKYFYGVSMDFGTFAEAWDTNLFAINQIADGITDRRAVGGEVRYFQPNRTAFGLVDYDINYNELNIALLTGNYIFPDQTTLNLSLDYRRSPILTTTNAIQGQTAGSLTALLETLSEDEVRQLAEDRTATSKSVTVGASRPLNSLFQVSADATASSLSGTDASGGVAASEGTGVELFYSLQLIGSSVFKEGDLAVLGLRYADTQNSDRYTVDINTRYPVTRDFRVNPRVRTDYRENKKDNGNQISVKPSVRFDYYWTRTLLFELDLGAEWTNDRIDSTSDDRTGFFVNVGYRVDF